MLQNVAKGFSKKGKFLEEPKQRKTAINQDVSNCSENFKKREKLSVSRPDWLH
jgi:hypothetical protein